MTALLAAALAAMGVYLLVGARAATGAGADGGEPASTHPGGRGRTGRIHRLLRARGNRRGAGGARRWMAQAGLSEVAPAEFAGVVAALAILGAVTGFVVFGSPLPAVAGAVAAGCTPPGWYRARRRLAAERAAEEWPRLIEELRLRTTTLGRSLPQALSDVGLTAPAPMRPAFSAARREWLISTDFGRTLRTLQDRLADPTADVVCETLLVAHEVGGADIGPRLAALAEDRRVDIAARRDARARQAGVRFARRFVLLVPLGMAAAGSLIGTGRRAYATPVGQALVVTAMALMLVCWLWAGRYLELPEPARVLVNRSDDDGRRPAGGVTALRSRRASPARRAPTPGRRRTATPSGAPS